MPGATPNSAVARTPLSIALAFGLLGCAPEPEPEPEPPRASTTSQPQPVHVARVQARSAPPIGCRLPEGDPLYCRECGQCGHGQGGCSSDSDCIDGLSCAPSAGESFGYAQTTSVCVAGSCRKRIGESHYCGECGPCGEGEGECDCDSDCSPGLICRQAAGASYGLPGRDVCAPDPCDTTIGASNYCRDCGPCPEGIGDCDRDDECMPGLACVSNAGESSGYPRSVDVCEAPSEADTHRNLAASPRGGRPAPGAGSPAAGVQSACRLPVGSSNYCRDCGPCPDGIGDCDSDDECGPGLECTENVGADYGLRAKADICTRSASARRANTGSILRRYSGS